MSKVVHYPLSMEYVFLRVGSTILRFIVWLGKAVTTKASVENLPSDVARAVIQVPSRQKGRSIQVHLYIPTNTEPNKQESAHMNFHGSGFMLLGLGDDISFCSQLYSKTRRVVFDCDCRKAPENPWPAAVEDAYDIASYILSQPEKYRGDNITVSGFSAGATIALSLSQSLGPEVCKGLTVFYGNPDLTKQPTAVPEKDHDSGIMLPSWSRSFFYKALKVVPRDGDDEFNRSLSPGLAPLEMFPPHIFWCCGKADNLYDSGDQLITRLKSEGHPDAVFLSVDAAAHAFDKVPTKIASVKQKVDDAYSKAFEAILRC